MSFITIDFETASGSLTSACSLGIVVVEENIIKEELHFLINPNEEFSDFNINIHGITPEDIKDADTFSELWPKIKHYFTGFVYAHNASFDIGVLKSLIEKYKLEVPNIRWGCTLKIARKLWDGELINNKLGTISKFLEMEHNYHNALSDALVCVGIINRGLRVMQVDTHAELYDALKIRHGSYNEKRYYGTYFKYGRNKKIEIIKNERLNDRVVYLAGKPSHMTRNELKEKLTANGVYIEKNISLGLDYFIILGNVPKAGLEKVGELNKKGHGIEIIDENTILRMIK